MEINNAIRSNTYAKRAIGAQTPMALSIIASAYKQRDWSASVSY